MKYYSLTPPKQSVEMATAPRGGAAYAKSEASLSDAAKQPNTLSRQATVRASRPIRRGWFK
jgi:hypothetical protein